MGFEMSLRDKSKKIRKRTNRIRNIVKYCLGIDKYGLLENSRADLNISKNVTLSKLEHIHFKDHIFISNNTSIITNEHSPVTIGNYVMIGHNVMIIGGNHDISNKEIPMMLQGEGKQGAITIEDDVWIGAGAIILAGVTVGKGCVIGAGSVVTKDVPEYCVAAGNPARVVKQR
ncbi:DapH/DapD/GlmU-related protein [Desulfoluna spongiiphila]|uniref:Maltose O-acetyltransferase n=2 Tax=Desulfoluna spongiiphila TaxID=419481 RepID=A0A1G5ASA4_9BACT|nr:DapH/DapD/GlmU-related protein [Desulfoluna spongiiphila]SCX80731.1 maltose O-acetyltransferase [Desulfoluna spongiiphila]